MRALGFGYVRSLFAIGALAGTVSCSGAGSGSAPGAFPGLLAVPSSSIVSSSPLVARSETTGTVASNAIFAPPGDLDATASIEYNWNLTGNYSGLIKQWQDGVEKRGTFSFSIFNSPPKPFFGGNGTIVIGQSSSAALMQGKIIQTFEHSVALTFSLSFGPGETCFATGTARRYRHVFEGVLKSPVGGLGCAPFTNSTTYFKVHPNT